MENGTFKNAFYTRPSEVEAGDCFPMKVVAVMGVANDWAAYWGPTDWSDERVVREGDKLPPHRVERLFFDLPQRAGRTYRE
jgi:hypothetical protein